MSKKKINNLRAVSTLTPQRISLIGGGTDLPSYFKINGGGVISTAIDKYIYVTVKKHSELFNENYRLSYSKTEHIQSIDEIENDIARECIKLVKIDPPLYVSTSADLPASSGLGSSSSFAVGLLNALHLLKGEKVPSAQLAEEACEVEINRLGHNIGKQDQYCAAFGGLNHFSFNSNGRVAIDPIVLNTEVEKVIFDYGLLIWTEIQRDANIILNKQNQLISKKTSNYNQLSNYLDLMKKLMLNPSKNFAKDFGKIIEDSWKVKKSLESSISNENINKLHETLIKEFHSFGGKISGAGGGGFLFELIPKEYQENLNKYFSNKQVVKIKYEPYGSRVLYELLD